MSAALCAQPLKRKRKRKRKPKFMKRTAKIMIYSLGAAGALCAAVVSYFLYDISPGFSTQNKLISHVRDGNYEKVKEIIDSGVDINRPAKWRGMMSGSNWTDGRTPLTQAAESNQFNIAELLLSRGADINRYDGFGQTAVHVATQHGRDEITRLLIDKKCDLNLMELRHEFNALSNAAILAKNAQLVKTLLEHGAILDTPDYVTQQVVKFVAETHDQSLIKLLARANK
jgi:ankyrin repeat protein